MTQIEVAWLAGLLEGEGSFFLPPPSEKVRTRCRISLEMTDKDIVERVAKLVGLGYMNVRNSDRHVSKGWKQSYCLLIRGKRAILVMQCILPYMGERRSEKIRMILKKLTPQP